MRRYLKYLRVVWRHKWFVFLECLKLGVPIWIAVFHDWDKFMPDEFYAYADYFYGDKIPVPNTTITDRVTGKSIPLMEQPEHVKLAFDHAWNLHQKRNRHHWQFWLLTPDKPRPNFWQQSYDGGMTHATFGNSKGQAAALIFHRDLEWFNPDDALVDQLDSDLRSTPVALAMPDVYRREMLADWRGAGRAYNANWTPDETRKWYEANKNNMRLHPETREWVEAMLYGTA